MASMRSLAWLMPLAFAACGKPSPGDQQASQVSQGDFVSATCSSAERPLLEGGAKPADVLVARALIAPFTRTDQSSCFGTPKLKRAKLAGKQGITGGPRLTRVAMAVDGSGSMAGRIGSRIKLELAREATSSFVDRLPNGATSAPSASGQPRRLPTLRSRLLARLRDREPSSLICTST